MCYLCRKDLREEKYQHFCQHFRVIRGPCPQCKKCDLYKSEDDRKVVAIAAAKAKKKWLATHPTANVDLDLKRLCGE